MIDKGLMATEGNCARNSENTMLSHSEKKARLAELWYQVVRNRDFKNLLLGYTLEQLARHSELGSIKRYCNYHTAKIPSSGEEDVDGSDGDVSQSSVWGTEDTGRQRTFSSGHRVWRSTHQEKLQILDQWSNSMYGRGSRYTNDYAASSRSSQEATSSRPARKQIYDPNRRGSIGESSHASNT